MLVETQLFEKRDKVAEAIQMLKDLEPDEGYYVADSGGKDSDVIYALVHMAEVKADYHHNLTTIDPPDVIYHMRKNHPETQIHRPEIPLLQMMIKKGFPPLRQQRWCCELYKERGGQGRFVVTGIRAQESTKRAKRKMIEFCYRDRSIRYFNIIKNWTKDDVWEFHKKYNISYCGLYDEGWDRIGCLMCPMAGKRRIIEAKRFPKYKKLFIKAFENLYNDRLAKGKPLKNWKNGEDFFYWWLNENKKKETPDQTVMFE